MGKMCFLCMHVSFQSVCYACIAVDMVVRCVVSDLVHDIDGLICWCHYMYIHVYHVNVDLFV